MNYSQNANAKKTNHRRTKRRRRKNMVVTFFVRLVLILVVVGCFAVGGAVLGAYFGIIENAPTLNTEDIVPEEYTSILYDQDGNEVDRLHYDENREYVKLSQIPEDLQHAVVAIEDERFYEHNGIDIRGIFRALVVNIRNKDISQGASTITQQLMKNEVLTTEQTFTRKIQEQYLAVTFEKELTETLGSKKAAKDYILELYLNTIALNHGLNGVQAASLFYFGKDVSELDLAECACIAGITQNPSAYSPISHPDQNKQRQTQVLNNMLDQGYITQQEYDQAINEDIYANLVGKTTTEEDIGGATHNYFVDSAVESLANQLQDPEVMGDKTMSRQQAYDLIYSGGLQIYLTMDSSIQSIMEDSFKKDELFPPSDTGYTATYTISVMDETTQEQQHYTRTQEVSTYDEAEAFAQEVQAELIDGTHSLVADRLTMARSLQAAMVIMDYRTGEVKALVGGREKTGDMVFNRATQALRQPGSCFKVLAAYAPAVDLGIVMPGTLIKDEPFTYKGWTPQNWYSGYRGWCTVREGVRDSMNILAAKTIAMVGEETAFDYLQNFGFTSLVESREVDGKVYSDISPAIALGGVTDGVSVLELTAAYGTIADGGVYHEPIFYTRVLDHNGNVLIDNTQTADTHRVLKETTAYLLTDMMEDVITSGTGTLARMDGMTVAGKTGTTNDDRDLVFAGYTPYYVGGIWMGYDTPKEISYDRSYHLLLWKDVMEQVHEGLSDPGFSQPDGIITQSLCSVSGAQPSSLCSQDYFGNTVSTDICAADAPNSGEVCTVHQQVTLCSESMCPPGENCPESSLIQVVLAVDPETGEVMNNPSSTTEDGKAPIDLLTTCSIEHEAEKITNPEASLPGLTGGSDVVTQPQTQPETGTNVQDPTQTPQQTPSDSEESPAVQIPAEEAPGNEPTPSQPEAPSDNSGGLPGLFGLPGLGGS